MLTCSSPHPYRSGAISRFRRRHLRSENPTGKRGLIVHPHRRFLLLKLSLFLKVDIVLLLVIIVLFLSSSSSFPLSEKLSSFFLLILLDFSPSVWTSLFCSVSFSFFPSISFKRRQTSAFVNGHRNSGQFVSQSSCGGHSFDRRLSIVVKWWFAEPPIVHSTGQWRGKIGLKNYVYSRKQVRGTTPPRKKERNPKVLR